MNFTTDSRLQTNKKRKNEATNFHIVKKIPMEKKKGFIGMAIVKRFHAKKEKKR